MRPVLACLKKADEQLELSTHTTARSSVPKRKRPSRIIESDEDDDDNDVVDKNKGSKPAAAADVQNFACILYLDSLLGYHSEGAIKKHYDLLVEYVNMFSVVDIINDYDRY